VVRPEPVGADFHWTQRLTATATIAGTAFAAVLAYRVAIPLETGVSNLA